MFLKSFDLHGFKSFKDKTKLEFKDGITTIVGPNGSGKSNIADAFRWVLGEQKIKALRGAKGEDVIFGGTKVHKPLGVAAVHMNINNNSKLLNLPYEEVSIARKIYRSGESDYMINGNSCRLKDIHELFNDTGLGKDSFSIIGQGEIEKILNAKPEERRGMIEELAGIVKYRNRKEESIKKIESAETNLRRILDIIEELEKNYVHLEESAKKAEYYLKLKKEADELELNLIVNDIYDSDISLKKIQEELTLIKNANALTSGKLKEREVVYEENNLQLLNVESRLKEAREKLLNLKDKINEIKTEIAKKENTIENNQEKITTLTTECTEISSKKTNLENIYQVKLLQKNKWVEMKNEKSNLIKTLEKQVAEITGKKNDLLEVGEDIHYTLIDIFQEIAVLHNELKSVDAEVESLNNKSLNAIKEKEGILTYSNELTERLKEKNQLREDTNSGLNSLKGEIVDLLEEKHKLEAKKEALAESQNKNREEYQHKYSRYKALLDIQKDYQGYYAGVKAVLQERDHRRLPDIVGVVGELIRVDKKYEKSIEIALGSSLQDIIVKDTNAAKVAIAFLKKNEKGRGTFLPLNVVKPRNLKKEHEYLLKEEGVYGLASSLIDINKEYKIAIENLVGNVLIVENLNIGERIARKANQSLRIVTLDGEIFNPGGSLTGGNTGKVNSVLSRNRNIEELKIEVDLLKQQINNVAEETDQINNLLYPIEGKINARNVKEKEYNDNLIQINQDIELRKQELINLAEKLEYMNDNSENIKEEINGLYKEKILLNQTLESKEKEKDNLEKAKSGKEEEVKQLDLEIEKMNDDITAEKIALNSLSEKEMAFNDTLKAYYSEQEDNEQLIKRKSILISETEKNNNYLKNEIKELNETYQLKETDYQELSNLILNSDRIKDDLTTENMVLEKEIKELGRLLRNEEEKEHSLDINLAKLETDRGNKVALLQEKFQLMPFEALELRKELTDRKQAVRRLKELQSLINNLGQVNIGAIDEFVRVKERLEFLVTQEKDLRTSIDSLEEIINDIDKIMKERFAKSFNELNNAFQETYQALFNGGEAYIELTNKDEILTSGIEIYSKPPGKTPKNMSMLSGGERALTALAILFSLLKIKPSPLCIIDEADASLDESNVQNFANYLKNYSEKTQFIVISHRQGTIEESDNLYGVTMDKSGVSKIISVSLTGERRKTNVK